MLTPKGHRKCEHTLAVKLQPDPLGDPQNSSQSQGKWARVCESPHCRQEPLSRVKQMTCPGPLGASEQAEPGPSDVQEATSPLPLFRSWVPAASPPSSSEDLLFLPPHPLDQAHTPFSPYCPLWCACQKKEAAHPRRRRGLPVQESVGILAGALTMADPTPEGL